LDKLKIVKSEVQNKFSQIYVGNLPHMSSIELVNYLSEFGELISFIDETKDVNSSSCYCEYVNDKETEEALKKLDNSKLKGRSVIGKRSMLMKIKDNSKTKITSTISKGSKF
jgi:RNA recognition motif-containing protein